MDAEKHLACDGVWLTAETVIAALRADRIQRMTGKEFRRHIERVYGIRLSPFRNESNRG
jgi:hypothetical protein